MFYFMLLCQEVESSAMSQLQGLSGFGILDCFWPQIHLPYLLQFKIAGEQGGQYFHNYTYV